MWPYKQWAPVAPFIINVGRLAAKWRHNWNFVYHGLPDAWQLFPDTMANILYFWFLLLPLKNVRYHRLARRLPLRLRGRPSRPGHLHRLTLVPSYG
jgi:hypothetical protein